MAQTDTAHTDPLLEEHRRDFHAFVRFATLGTAFVALVLVLMALFLL
jgi:hypothetical protein